MSELRKFPLNHKIDCNCCICKKIRMLNNLDNKETLKNLQLLYEKQSKYANIKLYETEEKKLMLVMDTFIQFIEGEDEKEYHRALSRGCLSLSSNANKFLILGGGDGFLARDLFKLNSKADITLVDIDIEVVNLCKTNDRLRKLNEDSLFKCNIQIGNAIEWVKDCKDKFDFIVLDFPDPNSEELNKLYEENFYKEIVKLLNSKGVLSIQVHCNISKKIRKIIKKLLKNARAIKYFMPFLYSGKIVTGKKEGIYRVPNNP